MGIAGEAMAYNAKIKRNQNVASAIKDMEMGIERFSETVLGLFEARDLADHMRKCLKILEEALK
jgi:hypothetical protein